MTYPPLLIRMTERNAYRQEEEEEANNQRRRRRRRRGA